MARSPQHAITVNIECFKSLTEQAPLPGQTIYLFQMFPSNQSQIFLQVPHGFWETYTGQPQRPNQSI